MYAWGRNDKGQLGLGHTENWASPSLVCEAAPSGGEVKAVQCAPEGTVVVDGEGRAFGTGWNEHGNLGVGDCEDRSKLVEAVVDASVAREGEHLLAVGGAHVLIA